MRQRQGRIRNKSTLLEQVQLIHCALPELSIEDLDLTTSLVGHTISAPIVIAAMTGGVDRAEEVNRDLASVAEETGLAFGFGSMRPLLQNENKKGYFVRDVAPTALLFGNIGIVQAYQSSTQQIVDMVGETDVNALCVHLNPAMEVIQTHGDRDFRGGIETLGRLSEALSIPIIAKETGCGLSRSIGQKGDGCRHPMCGYLWSWRNILGWRGNLTCQSEEPTPWRFILGLGYSNRRVRCTTDWPWTRNNCDRRHSYRFWTSRKVSRWVQQPGVLPARY